MAIVAGQASAAGVVLLMACPADLPFLRGEEIRLKQILLNLLSNAIKFTPPGGSVTLTTTAAADGGIEIAVGDTGIGMTAAELGVALEPFRQVEGARSRKYQGTGLGLPLAKVFVELPTARSICAARRGSAPPSS
ncbi:MAG: histidine kinase [Rhodospirillales bacterium]|nr:histidine kinase [Rhodospirillales bacterium]